MKTVVIMPGGFHPFHAGHYALYKQAQDAFPGADVYVAATNDTSARPFPFAVKEKLAKVAGVNPGKFVQVKSPFRAMEIVGHLDPTDTQLIFVRSEKDADKPPQAGGVKKDGNPAYLQPLKGQKELAPMAQHAYMAYLPTVKFGGGMTSATEIRAEWPTLDEQGKLNRVMSLYPKTQKNSKLADIVVKLLDVAIAPLSETRPGTGGLTASYQSKDNLPPMQQSVEAWGYVYNNKDQRVIWRKQFADYQAAQAWADSKNATIMGTSAVQPDQDYLEEKWSKKYKRSIDCSHPKGFSQRAHCAGRKK